jgi:hypothetical protein
MQWANENEYGDSNLTSSLLNMYRADSSVARLFYKESAKIFEKSANSLISFRKKAPRGLKV